VLVPGQTLRNIELAELLGTASGEILVLQVLQGGMGAVAKIQDTRGRLFALKFLELKGVESAALERFRREVQIWVTAASCDAVVDVLGTLRINEIPAVCAEWMPGGDLIRLMQSSDPRIFYSTLDRIIAALDWVHREYQIIHRDIKPSNVLLDQNGGALYLGLGYWEGRIQDGRHSSKRSRAPKRKPGPTLGNLDKNRADVRNHPLLLARTDSKF
jgi:serine/threonine protein kinase